MAWLRIQLARGEQATVRELLQKIADLRLSGPVTLVLAEARHQRNATVQAVAQSLGITRRFLPSYSPNHWIERLCRFAKRRALCGRNHATIADFKAATKGGVCHHRHHRTARHPAPHETQHPAV